MAILHPSGWRLAERTLDDLLDYHCPAGVTEPEFRRRLRHFLKSKNGLLGIGDVHPRPNPHPVSSASRAGRSFHQLQRFHDGSWWSSACDLVIRRPGNTHSSGAVPWSEVPVQGSAYAAEWGLHMNVSGESWHIQPIEYDGWYPWSVNRQRPDPSFELPCSEPAPPDLVFDPMNGLWGLWPDHPDKPRLSTEEFSDKRRERGDNQWRWTGDPVSYVQGVIFWKAGGAIDIDGHYGPETAGRVADVQTVFELEPDELVGPNTWRAIDYLAAS